MMSKVALRGFSCIFVFGAELRRVGDARADDVVVVGREIHCQGLAEHDEPRLGAAVGCALRQRAQSGC